MPEKTEDTNGARSLEVADPAEDVLTETSTSTRTGRSRKAEAPPSEEPRADIVEEPAAGTSMETAVVPVERPPVSAQRVMGHLTIRELEMMRKMEDIRRPEEISVGGVTNIEPEVIGAIAGVAARAVEGIHSLGTPSLRRSVRERLGSAEGRARGVEVEAGRREVILDITVRVIYGYSIPNAVIKVRRAVADRLLNLCGLEAKEINVRVTGLEFPERMLGRVQ